MNDGNQLVFLVVFMHFLQAEHGIAGEFPVAEFGDVHQAAEIFRLQIHGIGAPFGQVFLVKEIPGAQSGQFAQSVQFGHGPIQNQAGNLMFSRGGAHADVVQFQHPSLQVGCPVLFILLIEQMGEFGIGFADDSDAVSVGGFLHQMEESSDAGIVPQAGEHRQIIDS